MTAGAHEEDTASGPKVIYKFSDDGIAFSGDEDFMASQRRGMSITHWDVLAVFFLLAAIPFGWALWRLTGNNVVAVIGFGALIVLALAFTLRSAKWGLTGR